MAEEDLLTIKAPGTTFYRFYSVPMGTVIECGACGKQWLISHLDGVLERWEGETAERRMAEFKEHYDREHRQADG